MGRTQQLIKPIGVVKITEQSKSGNERYEYYRVQKKVNGIVHHICITKSFAVGMVAFDVYTRNLIKNKKQNLNFPGVPLSLLEATLDSLDSEVYQKVINRAHGTKRGAVAATKQEAYEL